MFLINNSLRNRMNSSMTYNDYQEATMQPPPTPKLRPKHRLTDDIPEIILDSLPLTYSPQTLGCYPDNFKTLHKFDDLNEKTTDLNHSLSSSQCTSISDMQPTKLMKHSNSDLTQTLKRKNSNIHFNCLNFIEQRILQKIHRDNLETFDAQIEQSQ